MNISFSCWFEPPSIFSVVSAVSTRDSQGPGDCGLGVFIDEEVDGVGSEGSGDTTVAIETWRPKFADLELSSSSAYILVF
jgi:hypothetical protein